MLASQRLSAWSRRVLDLLGDLNAEMDLAMIFITLDLRRSRER